MTYQGIIVAGPTGSGKSQLALDAACYLDDQAKRSKTLIVNADSMQVYKDLTILSARPTLAEKTPPHLLYGTLEAHESASVGWWQEHVKNILEAPQNTGKIPVIVGGTGLYLNVLLEGISPTPQVPKNIRNQATEEHHSMGSTSFFQRLKEVDPQCAAKLDPNNTQRVIRAWEVYVYTGRAFSYWQSLPKEKILPHWTWTVILIEPDRTLLYPHLEDRFKDMVHNGGLDEIKYLRTKNIPDNASILHAIGVQELMHYLDGKCTLDEAIEKGQQATRNYAKRQLTWFRHQLNDVDFTLKDLYTTQKWGLIQAHLDDWF